MKINIQDQFYIAEVGDIRINTVNQYNIESKIAYKLYLN